VLAFVIASIVPQTFYTEIRLRIDDPIAPQMPNIPNMSGAFSSFFGGAMPQSKSEDFFLELLNGRDNLVSTIKEFTLDTLYKTKNMEGTIKEFRKDLNIGINTRNNIIFCGFKGENRELASAIVSLMANNANDRFLSLQRERLAMSTKFLAERRNQLLDSLELSSRELIEFYRENNVINIKEQIELTLLTLARYEEQINMSRVNEMISRSAVGSNTPLSHEARARSQVLQREFQKIRGDYDENYKPSKQSVLINTDWGLDKLLFEQMAAAKIDILKNFMVTTSRELAISEAQLAKEIPAVQIIQDTFYPDWKIAPKRAKWMMVSFFIALVLTVTFVLLSAFVRGELEGASDSSRQKFVNLLRAVWK